MAVTRTIYLPTDQDLKLYNKAKKIAAKDGNSVSSYVLKALSHYINNESKKVEYPLYILLIGESNQLEKKKFHGLYLTSELIKTKNTETEIQIYLTRKESIIVYQRERDLDSSNERATYQLYSSIDEVPNISETLYHMTKEKLDIEEAELLDI